MSSPTRQMVGIGLTFKRGGQGGYIVKRVVEGGPSYNQGSVAPGDAFLEVDGVSVSQKTPEELTKLVLGPSGSTVDLLVLREGKAIRCSIRRAPIEMTEEVRKNRKIQNISEHRLEGAGKEKERGRHDARESSKKRSEDASKEIVKMLPRSGGVDSALHGGVSPHGVRVSGGGVAGTSDAVLEGLRDKAIATRTPPKISHKELLTIAGVKDVQGPPASPTHSNGTSSLSPPSPMPSSTYSHHYPASPSPSSQPPPSFAQTPPQSSHRYSPPSPASPPSYQPRNDSTYPRMGAPLGSFSPDQSPPNSNSSQRYQGSPPTPSQGSNQPRTQSAPLAEEFRELALGRGSGSHTSVRHSGPAGTQNVHSKVRYEAYDRGGGGQRPSAGYGAQGNRSSPPGDAAANLEIYKAVADEEVRRSTGGVRSESSWHSVESDRELAIRLQTEEVLQHSLSNEWSAHSLGGGGATNGSGRGSAVYASAQASYSSDDVDGGGRDLDDGTLRQMMGYGGGGVKHVNSSGSVGSGSWNSNGGGTSGGRESWQSYKVVDGGNLSSATPPQHSTIARVVGASHYSDMSPPSPSNVGGDLRNVLLENAVRTDVGFFGVAPTAKADHGAVAASAPPVEHTARSHVTADVASVKGHATVDSGRVGSQGSGPVLLSGPRDVLAGGGDVGRVAGMADGGGSGGGGKRRMWVMRHGMRIDEHDVTWREKSNRPYDPYLTSEGRRQARAAASMILAESERDGAVVHVVSSPFLRCLQTAAEVANSLGIERITIDYGLCEALLPRNVATSPTYLQPDRLRMTDGSFARISFTHTPQPEPVWPEDLATARARYTDAFIRIPEALGPAGNIVLIAHGDTVAQFVAIAKGIPEDSVYSVPNCAIASADVLSSSGGKYGRLRAGDDILTLDGLVE